MSKFNKEIHSVKYHIRIIKVFIFLYKNTEKGIEIVKKDLRLANV